MAVSTRSGVLDDDSDIRKHRKQSQQRSAKRKSVAPTPSFNSLPAALWAIVPGSDGDAQEEDWRLASSWDAYLRSIGLNKEEKPLEKQKKLTTEEIWKRKGWNKFGGGWSAFPDLFPGDSMAEGPSTSATSLRLAGVRTPAETFQDLAKSAVLRELAVAGISRGAPEQMLTKLDAALRQAGLQPKRLNDLMDILRSMNVSIPEAVLEEDFTKAVVYSDDGQLTEVPVVKILAAVEQNLRSARGGFAMSGVSRASLEESVKALRAAGVRIRAASRPLDVVLQYLTTGQPLLQEDGYGFVATNIELTKALRDPREFRQLLQQLSKEERLLDGINVATILMYASKARIDLFTAELLQYLTKSLQSPYVRFEAREVGVAVYGLQSLGRSKEERRVRELVAAIIPKVRQCEERLSAKEIGMALYGLRSLTDSPEARGLVAALTDKVWESRKFDAQSVGNALYGLQSLSDTAEVRKLLTALAYQIEDCGQKLRAQHVGNALYGLQGLSDSAEARGLLRAMRPKILQCNEELRAQHVGNALYGLRWLGDTPETRSVVGAMVSKVETCSEKFGAQEVANALYGLQSLAASKEARALVMALTPKVQRCSESLEDQAIGSALYGLQRLEDSSEVRGLLRALTPRIEQCSMLSSRSIGEALYGLQRLHDSPEVRELAKALTPKVHQCTQKLNAQSVAMALYGLQSLGDSPEVRGLVAALTPKVIKSTDPLSAQNVGMALYGLQSLRDSVEARGLVAALTAKVRRCGELDAQAVGNGLYGLHSLGNSEEVNSLVRALTPKVRQCKQEFSAQEISMALFGLEYLQDSADARGMVAALAEKVRISKNEHLKDEVIGQLQQLRA